MVCDVAIERVRTSLKDQRVAADDTTVPGERTLVRARTDADAVLFTSVVRAAIQGKPQNHPHPRGEDGAEAAHPHRA